MKFVYLLLLILQYSLFCPHKKLCQYESKSDVKIKFRNECGRRISLQQHDGNCDKQFQGEIGPNDQETITAKLTTVFTATLLGEQELKPINGECYQQPENKADPATLAGICTNSGPVGPARTSICPKTSCTDPHITETTTKVQLVFNNRCNGSAVTVKQGEDCDGQTKQVVVSRDGELSMEATTHTWFTAQAAGEKVQINDTCRFFPVKQNVVQQVNLCAKGDYGLDLSNASELIKGKLQIIFEQKWYRLCKDNFTDVEADLACRQMGHKKGALVTVQQPKQQFSNGCQFDTLQISSTCTGKENSLKECISGEKVQQCKDDVDVGVICQKGTTMQTKDLRIVDSRLHDNTTGFYKDQESNEGETYCEQVKNGGEHTKTYTYSETYAALKSKMKAIAKKYWVEIGLMITAFFVVMIGVAVYWTYCKKKSSEDEKEEHESETPNNNTNLDIGQNANQSPYHDNNAKNVRDEVVPIQTNTYQPSIPQNDFNNTVNKSQIHAKQVDTGNKETVVQEIADQFDVKEEEIIFGENNAEPKSRTKRNSKFKNKMDFNNKV